MHIIILCSLYFSFWNSHACFQRSMWNVFWVPLC